MKIVSVVNFAILQSLVAQKDYFAGKLFFWDTFSYQKRILQLLLSPVTGDLNLQRFIEPDPSADFDPEVNQILFEVQNWVGMTNIIWVVVHGLYCIDYTSYKNDGDSFH